MSIAAVIHVRQLAWEEADIAQLLEIERSSFNRYDAFSLADFERWYHYNPDLCIVAEVDGHIAGYAISRILPGIGDLASLAINPAYRRRGVGRALLIAIEHDIREYGVFEINLEVRETNLAGLAFWQNMGFVPFGTLPGFYEDGEDAVRMRKILSAETDQSSLFREDQ
jgi:ribosomal-protein-alanine N-acetyltransferase